MLGPAQVGPRLSSCTVRAERAAASLRAGNADLHLIEALERTQEELSDVGRRLRQGTLFSIPKEQLTL